MNFFEQELRKICEKSQLLQNRKYVGRTCYGTLGDDIRARIEFAPMRIQDQYHGLKITILNRTEGRVDDTVVRFLEVLGRKIVANTNFPEGVEPHVWSSGYGKWEWYAYKPNEEDYKVLCKDMEDYFSVFQPEMSQNKTMGGEEMQTYQIQ